MLIEVNQIKRSQSFDKDFEKSPTDIKKAAKKAVDDILKRPIPKSRRLHRLGRSRLTKDNIYVIDVFSNHSYQITFEINGNTAILRRLGTHKQIDKEK